MNEKITNEKEHYQAKLRRITTFLRQRLNNSTYR